MIDFLFNKEDAVANVISDFMIKICEELNCDFKDIFIMIKPINENFDFKIYVYKDKTFIRETSLKEILNQ
ncbi:MAG: hypothetical protein QXM96_00215 [Candidatus Woesearchaeota archaeon]